MILESNGECSDGLLKIYIIKDLFCLFD